MKTLLTLSLLALFALDARAEVSKWIDENGVMHYSDTRPVGINADSVRNVTGKDTAPPAANDKPRSYLEREVELKKTRQEKQAADAKLAQEKAAQEEKQRNCANARESLRTLEGGTRISVYDANGERYYLDEAELEQRVRAARAAVQENCN
ncbi:DUF4124 domain-containing protein [Ferrigenium sp. UT5]|uniref:DUF4124 domain-containing protein n=1 Tax=Ferrigenium sp. UT5 TaxID=3242105 RepID=UPI00354D2535